MVTSGTERKDSPSCSLQRIQELASQEAVAYGSSTVEIDISNLRYSHEDVCECLRVLAPEDFSHAERYGPKQVWLDVYKISMEFPDERGRIFTDELYIKLKLDKDCVTVVLMSFHPERNS
jgi:Motility quorum-sensing regulator, toxin of MqsA